MSSFVVSLIYMRARRATEVFSPTVRELWNKSELRVMVLLSLILQILLIFLGSRRKHSRGIWIRVVLWCAYLTADWVATVALGVILDNTIEGMGKSGPLHSDVEITAFWAPFLLLHLGGPDTITAYAMEDNELWLRHFLGLGVETGVALYIFLVSWIGSRICILSIPILCAGIIKYGERTWALRAASNEQFRRSMLISADPGPNYAKFMQEVSLKQFEGFEVIAEEFDELRLSIAPSDQLNGDDDSSRVCKSDDVLVEAYDFLQVYKRLFVELTLGVDDMEYRQSLFLKFGMKDAYKLIEIELSFVYDMLYTKSPLMHSLKGGILRIITCACTCSVLIFFTLAYHHKHSNIDLFITYLLMCAAVLLEVYAILLKLSSDWTDLCLIKHNMARFRKLIAPLVKKPRRWSNSISQFNAWSFYNRDASSIIRVIQNLLGLSEKIEKYQSIKYKEVSGDLQELIFHNLRSKSKNLISNMAAKDNRSNIIFCRGSEVLKRYSCTELDWSVQYVDFDQSILIWHIATYLCYKMNHPKNSEGEEDRPKISEGEEDRPKYSEGEEDHPKNSEGEEDRPKNSEGKEDRPKKSEGEEDRPKYSEDKFRKMSKRLSQYMVYLLVMQPKMLPGGIGMIRFRDTEAELSRFLKENESKDINKSKAIDMLRNVNSIAVEPIKVKGDRSKSVLFEGCRLASQLQEALPEKDKGKKWEMICNVWVEMLAYAASQCRGSDHAQQLRRGGELLSHVWLLMAHFGLTQPFQVSKGYAIIYY